MNERDLIAQSQFGMDYDQLGANEQEWVRDTFLDLYPLELGNSIDAANDSC